MKIDPLIAENRIGVFRITRATIKHAATNLLAVLADVLVVDVQCDVRFGSPSCDIFRFRGYSPRFDPVVEGCMVPEYEFIIEKATPGAWTHQVERV